MKKAEAAGPLVIRRMCPQSKLGGGREPESVAIINCLDRSLDLCVCGLSHWPKEMTVETFRPFSFFLNGPSSSFFLHTQQ